MIHVSIEMRSDATTLQLGDHLHKEEDEEQDEEQEDPPRTIPPLMRGQSREWRSEDLPLTPPKSKLLPPASWMSQEDGVSLEVRSSSEGHLEGSASPEPLAYGPGAEAVLQANGVFFPVGKSEAACKDLEPEQEGNNTSKADDHDDTSNAHDQEKEADDQEKKEDDQDTRHYSPEHMQQKEEQGEEQDAEEEDEKMNTDAEIPLVLHHQQRVLRKPAGQFKKKPMPEEPGPSEVESKAKPKAKCTAKATAKGKAKAKAKAKGKAVASTTATNEASENAKPADAPQPKKKGWPKGKAKAKAKQCNGPPKRKDPPADEKDEEGNEEDKSDAEDIPKKRPKKGVCLVTPEQKKQLKSSLGNMYYRLCACVYVFVCLLACAEGCKT